MSKKEGGAFWKRKKIEKQNKLKEVVEKCPKIQSFFPRLEQTNHESPTEPSCSNMGRGKFITEYNHLIFK